ncbi:DNA cytosine methyltransferase [Collimonas silvisoli]|uniref:DNA cytosine methyltransferase n=1 Tax=Collimonas silvisoli TaxID=2825884 RepID=UPI001B8B217E|nr:DNA cytosine methyltransferase [Collimonas silvisoli]
MPKIIDLFAGAGGLSLGAARAGFDIAAAVELDPFAVATHIKNFPNSIHLAQDVSTLSGNELLQLAKIPDGGLDGLVGGPPCQGFSTMGRRDVADLRNNLFDHFFRLVAETRPAFFLAENVPGILDPQYDEIRDHALAHIDRNTYNMLPPIEVKASRYGAPTVRTRFFFFGYDPNRFNGEFNVGHFEPLPNIAPIVVETALTGLPNRIDCRWISEEAGWRSIEDVGDGYFFDRVTNSVPEGIGDLASLERYFGYGKVSGCMGTRHSDEVRERYAALEYGAVDKISKSVRLNPAGFCPTLRAGTGKDKGSYQAVRPIHHRSARVITPREAARLQGFPDWFVFHRTKWHSFRQIGNSVSPIVSEIMFQTIANQLR